MKKTQFIRGKAFGIFERLICGMLIISLFLTGCGGKKEEEKESDTIRWFNASYAILTELNGWDYTLFGGLPINEENAKREKETLERDWEVTDRASADETLEWALNEGHRTGYAELMKMFDEMGLSEIEHSERLFWLMEEFEMDPVEAAQLIDFFDVYEEKGAGAIDAWDYSRALNLCSFYYVAGYYTREEALDKSLEIAKVVQAEFDSWDDYVDSYLLGYEYWSEESYGKRERIYGQLKIKEDNPYSVDFKTNLEKTW